MVETKTGPPEKASTRRDLVALPKAHLHLHLEGSSRPSTVAELAAKAGVGLDGLMEFSTLREFVDCYRIVVSAIQDLDDIERIAYELLVDEAAQGVGWCEPVVGPHNYAPRLGPVEEVWAAMKAGFTRAAAETGIGWGVILGHIRTDPPDVAEAKATWAAEHAGGGVVGFGIVGDEELAAPGLFARAFAIAGEAGLLTVPHAGETAGPESVRGAVSLGAHRLAHGVRSAEDPDLLRELADLGIACDVCPTSNLKLSVVDHLGNHPLPQMLEAGVPVTLGSDDQLFFGSHVSDEYQLVREAFGLTDSELAGVARTAVRVSGAPDEVKQQLASQIDAWLAT